MVSGGARPGEVDLPRTGVRLGVVGGAPPPPPGASGRPGRDLRERDDGNGAKTEARENVE